MAHPLATAVTPLLICLIMCHRILAINISPNNEVEELSGNQVMVSCNQLSKYSMIEWSIIPLHGQEKQVGMCNGERCISSHGQKIDVQRINYSSSRLVSVNVTREWAGTVVCKERLTSGSELSVNSTLDVYYNYGITNVSMVVNREDWTLITSFKVAKIFSARRNYGAKLNCTSLNSTLNMSLVSYNESSLVYNVGYFQLTSFKSQFDSHVNLTCLSTVVVYPGARLERLNERGGVKESSTPQIVCDLTYIPEEGPFRCSCNTQCLGNPEGRLTWRLGQQVLTSGDYGVKQLPLPSDIINRSHQGKKLACEVEWLYDKRSEINIAVAYGPDDVVIKPYIILFRKDNSYETFLASYPETRGHVYLPPDDTSNVTLVCEARNVQPLKSEMVTWGGLCYGQRGFYCKLTFKGKKDDGKEVTCSVINNVNNDHKANTSIILNVSDGPDKVHINIQYHTTSTPGKCHVTLTCEAPGVKPSTYDMFTWDGMCKDQQGSRCVIIADQEEDDGKEVTCTVTNHVNHRRTASAIVTLMLSGCEDQGTSMSKGVGTGIGVTLTIEILVVGVVVVVVIWRRRRFQRDQMYDKPIQDPGLNMNNAYDTMRAGPDTCTDKSQNSTATSSLGEIYENLTFAMTEKPVKAKQQHRTQRTVI